MRVYIGITYSYITSSWTRFLRVNIYQACTSRGVSNVEINERDGPSRIRRKLIVRYTINNERIRL